MRRVLLISPYFPPMGVSGARRALHMVRHLPDAGWRPVVLAAPPVSEALDTELADTLPDDVTVCYGFAGVVRPWLERRVRREGERTSRPPNAASPVWRRLLDTAPATAAAAVDAVGTAMGRALEGAATTAGRAARLLGERDWSFLGPVDRFLADVPAALETARMLIHEHQPSLIHCCAEPWSSLIVGLQLHRELGLPLLVDLHAPLSLDETAARTAVAQLATRRFETELFRAASRVVCATEAARDAYRVAYEGRVPAATFCTVRPGFDRGISQVTASQSLAGMPFNVTCVSHRHRRVPEHLFEAFGRFVRDEGLDPRTAHLVVIGAPADECRAAAVDHGVADFLFCLESASLTGRATVLDAADLVVVECTAREALTVPYGFYDALGAQRPVLAISANADVERIVHETGAGWRVIPGDVDGAVAAMRAVHAGEPSRPGSLELFTAAREAREMARVYREVRGLPPGTSGGLS